MDALFQARFEELFRANFASLHRYLARLTGDTDVASDLAQEAFVRLLQRGALPDDPRAWLVAVAMNLLRTRHARDSRRSRILTVVRDAQLTASPPRLADEQVERAEASARVRKVLDSLPERERQLLLLHTEGYSYREMASALDLTESSVGTLLSRARSAFRTALNETSDAS